MIKKNELTALGPIKNSILTTSKFDVSIELNSPKYRLFKHDIAMAQLFSPTENSQSLLQKLQV